MITNNKSKEHMLYKSQCEQVDPDQTYISISSIFKRSLHGVSLTESDSESLTIQGDDLIGRSKAISAADRRSEYSSMNNNSLTLQQSITSFIHYYFHKRIRQFIILFILLCFTLHGDIHAIPANTASLRKNQLSQSLDCIRMATCAYDTKNCPPLVCNHM